MNLAKLKHVNILFLIPYSLIFDFHKLLATLAAQVSQATQAVESTKVQVKLILIWDFHKQ